MKKSDLEKMVSSICRDVMMKNQDMINNRVREVFKSEDGNSTISTNQAIGSATALCLTLGKELSAAITGRILVDLGLVALEAEE